MAAAAAGHSSTIVLPPLKRAFPEAEPVTTPTLAAPSRLPPGAVQVEPVSSCEGPPVKRPRTYWDVVMNVSKPAVQTVAAPTRAAALPPLFSNGTTTSAAMYGLVRTDKTSNTGSVNNRKPFSCNLCDSTFARSSHLRLHVRTIHEKAKPFACEQCPATFGHVSSKYRHYRTVHLKRRDFKCDRCGQTFAERSAVFKHCRTVHEGSRPYPCEICGFRFHFKLHLTQHIATVHEKQRPHRCKVCGACFGQRSSLNRHSRQIHGLVTKRGGALS